MVRKRERLCKKCSTVCPSLLPALCGARATSSLEKDLSLPCLIVISGLGGINSSGPPESVHIKLLMSSRAFHTRNYVRQLMAYRPYTTYRFRD